MRIETRFWISWLDERGQAIRHNQPFLSLDNAVEVIKTNKLPASVRVVRTTTRVEVLNDVVWPEGIEVLSE